VLENEGTDGMVGGTSTLPALGEDECLRVDIVSVMNETANSSSDKPWTVLVV